MISMIEHKPKSKKVDPTLYQDLLPLLGEGETLTEIHDEWLLTTSAQRLAYWGEQLSSAAVGLEFLSNMSAIDYETEFLLACHLRSTTVWGRNLTLHVAVDRDNPVLPTLTKWWNSANWQEREIYDLMGFIFEGHPNLKRILLYDEFVGHPLRKDFIVKSRRQPRSGTSGQEVTING